MDALSRQTHTFLELSISGFRAMIDEREREVRKFKNCSSRKDSVFSRKVSTPLIEMTESMSGFGVSRSWPSFGSKEDNLGCRHSSRNSIFVEGACGLIQLGLTT